MERILPSLMNKSVSREQSIVMSVCLYVRLSVCLSAHTNDTTNLHYFSVHVSYDRGSVNYWRRCDMTGASLVYHTEPETRTNNRKRNYKQKSDMLRRVDKRLSIHEVSHVKGKCLWREGLAKKIGFVDDAIFAHSSQKQATRIWSILAGVAWILHRAAFI